MSSLQAPMPNTGDTVHVVSVYRATLLPPLQTPSVQDRPLVGVCRRAGMHEREGTYAFNQKCAVQSQHVSRCYAVRYDMERRDAIRYDTRLSGNR